MVRVVCLLNFGMHAYVYCLLRLLGLLSTALWTVEHAEAIPRSVHFMNSGEDVSIYSLESGEM